MHFCRPLENNFFQNFINHLATLNKTNHFRNMDAWFLVILLDKLFQLLILSWANHVIWQGQGFFM